MRTLLEKLYVIVALLYLSGAVIPLFSTDPTASNSGSPVLLAIQTLIYLTMCAFLALRAKQFIAVSLRLPWIVALLLLAELSTFWSAMPELTWRRAIVVTFTAIFGVYFSVRYSIKEQLKLLAVALGIAAILSAIVAIGLPQYGVMHDIHAGDWQGVFDTKNVLGRIMALCGVVFALSLSVFKKERAVHYAGLFLSCALVWMSGSKTALVVGVVLLALYRLYRAAKWRMTTLVPVAVIFGGIVTGACTVALEHQSELFDLLGRDDTMTGRTMLWAVVGMAIARKPWLGYGLNGFWAGMRGASADVITSVRWEAPHAHNGILDLCLDLGIVGVLLFLIGFLIAVRDAIRMYRKSDAPEAVWPLLFLSFLFLYNLTESAILRPNSVFWALYISAVANSVGVIRATAIQNSVAIEKSLELEAFSC